ncbi:hypothetical protein EG349_10350 [Chryseobacterium shandongense]|uniref:Phage protein D n=2 Tax=Chryseobacterium TaxID=59732 RepID=A0AAD0YDU8_9FLAO|nr:MULTISPECIES: hypothetical protein [Chryseobacterium]AZA87160.1 hypothetical protein EG349_10350 [Chryseobacterium shandongense]AZA95589.1 hypothetical protein EG353_08425 [Chryseobacterium shandongense]MEC3876131.1 hypothetical protein [Chryseobacterium sp. T9W2-O]
MTLTQSAEIIFNPGTSEEFSIFKINSVELEKSWKMLTATAQITLPRNTKDFDRLKVNEVFKRDTKCIIRLGYDQVLIEEFSGYIAQVSADFPIKIKLEDDMRMLRRIPVNFAAKTIGLKEFISKYVTKYPIDIDADIQLGAVRFSKTTLGEVFDKLQKDMSIYSFIRNGKLTIAKPYSDMEKVHHFDLERNCVDNNLNYLSKEERLIKIVGKSIFGKGKKLEFEFGDDDPKETLNWHFTFREKKDLEAAVKKMYNDRKKDGFDGSLTTFGLDSVQHGEKVYLTSTQYPDRTGTYYIDRVQKSFGKDGYRQNIELGQRAY